MNVGMSFNCTQFASNSVMQVYVLALASFDFTFNFFIFYRHLNVKCAIMKLKMKFSSYRINFFFKYGLQSGNGVEQW